MGGDRKRGSRERRRRGRENERLERRGGQNETSQCRGEEKGECGRRKDERERERERCVCGAPVSRFAGDLGQQEHTHKPSSLINVLQLQLAH